MTVKMSESSHCRLLILESDWLRASVSWLRTNTFASRPTPDLTRGIQKFFGGESSLYHLGVFFFLYMYIYAHIHTGFPSDSDGKESVCNAGIVGLVPGLERSLEEVMATHSSILASRIP